MAPSLRKSTQDKTTSSAKAAKDAGYVRRPRPPPTRKQRYRNNKGLVIMKRSEALDAISIANATTSRLLRLPAEIRNMIFKYALEPEWLNCIALYYNRRNCISRSGTSTRARNRDLKGMAVNLRRVCRQIYAETATMMYSETCFAFRSERGMYKWLGKRILAQREAIRWVMLPKHKYSQPVLVEGLWKMENVREEITKRVKKTCPNLVEMRVYDWLHEQLYGAPTMYAWDGRHRTEHPSSGDEDPWEDYSDFSDFSDFGRSG